MFYAENFHFAFIFRATSLWLCKDVLKSVCSAYIHVHGNYILAVANNVNFCSDLINNRMMHSSESFGWEQMQLRVVFLTRSDSGFGARRWLFSGGCRCHGSLFIRPITSPLFLPLYSLPHQMGWRRLELSCAQSLVKRIWISGWPARITRRLNRSPRWHRKLRKSLRSSSPSSPVKRWAWSLILIWTFTDRKRLLKRLALKVIPDVHWESKKSKQCRSVLFSSLKKWLEIFLKYFTLCHETKRLVRAVEDMMSCLTNGLPLGRTTHSRQFESMFSFSKLGKQFGNSKWDEQQELEALSSSEAGLCVDSRCQIFDWVQSRLIISLKC